MQADPMGGVCEGLEVIKSAAVFADGVPDLFRRVGFSRLFEVFNDGFEDADL